MSISKQAVVPEIKCVLVSVLLMWGAVCHGSETPVSGKRIVIPRIDEAPSIDGQIAAGEWDRAASVSDLHQVEPFEFSDPSERTVWYIAYDADALYVAAHAFDTNPDGIVAQMLRQGGPLLSDDSMHILLDAFNNKRSGYSFGLNPNGVREDAIFTSATRLSNDWEGIWRGAAVRTDAGWSMEMAIPFNTLTFDPENTTWGINFKRKIARKNETIAWSSRNGQFNPTVSGEAYGLSELSQGMGLDVIPSMSSTYRRNQEFGTSASELRPSIDISYKLTPSINLSLTVNTDFAATEVDGRQLDLERFSLFFPEKRSFFLTDFDIFQFGGISTEQRGPRSSLIGVQSGTNGLAFFSRRIGLSDDQELVDLIAGAKVSGRIGNYDFGTLLIRQDEFEDLDATNLLVTRISRGIFVESSIGAIVTNGDPGSNSQSSLYGLDYIYRNTRIGANRSLEGQFWVQRSSNEGVSGDDMAYSAAIGFPTRSGFEAGVQIHAAQENYRPALGFANRVGVRLYSANIGYRRLLTNHRLVQRVSSNIEFSRWEYLDTGRIQSQELQFNFLGLASRAGDFGRLEYSFEKEGLLPGEQPLDSIGIEIPAGEYAFERFGLFLRTAGHRKLALEMRYDDGGFYNGNRRHLRPKIQWRPNKHLFFALQYDYFKYEFPGVNAITRQVTFENEVVFNSKLSLQTLVQYDNVSDDVGINIRSRYNWAAGKDFWLVLNHNMSENTEDESFHSVQTTAAVKIRYTFRF